MPTAQRNVAPRALKRVGLGEDRGAPMSMRRSDARLTTLVAYPQSACIRTCSATLSGRVWAVLSNRIGHVVHVVVVPKLAIGP